MFVRSSIFFQIFLLITYTKGRKGVGDSEQDWGYITVRPNAHMFWWLYYTSCSNISSYTERPLIIWLQGGPGMPSSGYGNFEEIGPLDVHLKKREYSFIENFNVLLIDNPIGVGYSYISGNRTHFATNGDAIGEDLYNFFKVFITSTHPEFKTVPTYVFGESYGGKMATEFLYKLVQNGIEKLGNIKGLGLGDAYISPIEYIKYYAPLALNLGLVDKQGFRRINNVSKKMQKLIAKGDFEKAQDTEHVITSLLAKEASLFDLYNFLAETSSNKLPKVWEHTYLLENLMNNRVKNALNIPSNVSWSFFEDNVYDSLRGDLIRNVTHKVEEILNSTDVKIIVYNGVLDFLVNTAGTLAWLDNLNWEGKEDWFIANRTTLVINEISEGYCKRAGNLVFYAVLRAGHSVPVDALPVMNEILQLELLS